MRNLARHLRTPHRAIRNPWPTLEQLVRPGPGHLCLVIADAGVGKSAFILNWALKSQEPTLYLSWDTDLFLQGVRTVSMLAERPTDEVTELAPEWADWLETQEIRTRFVDETLTPEEIQELVRAEADYWDLKLIVVDTLSYAVRSQDGQSYDEALMWLHRLARDADACVMVLHHLNRRMDKTPGQEAPDLGRARYAGDRDAEFVLGLWTPAADELNISILKNRTGHSMPDGSLYVTLERDLARMRVEEASTFGVEQYRRDVGVGA